MAIPSTASTSTDNRVTFLARGTRLIPVTPLSVGIPLTGGDFQVKAVNSAGQAIAGIPITFTVSAMRGHFADGLTTVIVYTNSQGVATSPLFLPSSVFDVAYDVTATSGPLRLVFRAINVNGRLGRGQR